MKVREVIEQLKDREDFNAHTRLLKLADVFFVFGLICNILAIVILILYLLRVIP